MQEGNPNPFGQNPGGSRPAIPPPTGLAGRCPKCGHHVAAGAVHCPQCGHRMATAPTSCLSILGIIGLALLALVLGSFGACALLLSVPSMLGSDGAGMLPLLLGVGALYLTFLCVRKIGRVLRGENSSSRP